MATAVQGVQEPEESKTKSQLSCRALNCILVYVEEKYGTEALERFVAESGLTLSYLRDQHNWVSWSYYCSLLKTLVKWTGDPDAPYVAGTYSWNKRSWGFFYYITYALGSVGNILKKLVHLVPHFNKCAEWTILELHKNRALIRIRMKDGYPIERVCCESRMGQLAGIPKAFGMPLGKVREIQCQSLGDDACLCEMSWINRPKRFYGFIGLFIGSLIVLAVNRTGIPFFLSRVEVFCLLILSYFAGRFYDVQGILHHYQEQTDALEESIKVIEAKYLKLKQANDGMFALHEISQAVVTTLDLNRVLKILLRMVVDRLGFDRSFIMLADETSGNLHHGRVYGDDSIKDFVEGLTVPMDLGSSMAEEVLRKWKVRIVTSDFIDGDRASELEKQIYRISGTREYIIAPLVSQGRLLGVIAADNVRSKKKIGEKEQSLMSSLANNVVLAIENARSFRMIEELNVTLEKKVEERTRELERSLKELRLAQEELVHSEKMSSLGLLFSGLAHEINNPINFAYNGVATLEKSIRKIHELSEQCLRSSGGAGGEGAIRQKLLETIEDSGRLMQIVAKGLQRTRNLVGDLKHFSRKDREEPEFLTLDTPVQSALTMLNHEMTGRIRVHQGPGFKQKIRGRPGQLNQVFLNLLHNAVQAIEGEGNIWIRADSERSGEIRIHIRDDGVGIPDTDLDRVFEPFFTTKRSGEGTGLGMSICRKIVENHGGRIELTSAPGKGTEVTVTLPVREEVGSMDWKQ